MNPLLMQIDLSWRSHFTKNSSVDHAHIWSVWYDVIPVIIMATDLPHEIEAKYQPVHLNFEIKWHWRTYLKKRNTRGTSKNDGSRKRSPMSNAIISVERVQRDSRDIFWIWPKFCKLGRVLVLNLKPFARMCYVLNIVIKNNVSFVVIKGCNQCSVPFCGLASAWGEATLLSCLSSRCP